MLPKKAIAAVAGVGTVTVGAGGTAIGLSSSSGTDDSLVDTTPEEKQPTESQPVKQVSVEISQPQSQPSSTSIQPKANTISHRTASLLDGTNANNNAGRNGYLGTEGAVSNVDFSLSGAKEFSSSNSSELSAFLGQSQKGDYQSTKSSLRIQIQKAKYNNGKWWGQFSGFWSFAYNNKGFITFNVAKSNHGKYLDLEGVFYLVEKDSDGKGKIKYYKEQKDTNKKITVSNFKNYFPTPYWGTKQGEFNQYYYNYGGFGTEAELKNICGYETDSCVGTASGSTIVGSWEGAGREEGYENNCGYRSYSKYGWCDNVYEWSSDKTDAAELQGYDYMYGNNELNLKKALSSFYKGYWKKDFGNIPKFSGS